MSRWWLPALGLVLAAAGLADARPVDLAGTASGGVAVYRALGQYWLVPFAPSTLSAHRLPAEPALLFTGATGEIYTVAGKHLYLFASTRPARLSDLGAVGAEPVRRGLAADLDGDGVDEVLLIRGEGTAAESRPGLGARLEVWRVEAGAAKLLWQGLDSYHPWQVAAGDVNGDGRSELGVGAWTRAVYDPQWAERPWLFRWKEGQPFAEWLGSRLAHPFRDFTLAPLGPGEPASLAAVEATRDGGEMLSVYSWNGFGFSLEHPGPSWDSVVTWAPLPAGPAGCPALAAVIEPGPALVLLSLPEGGPGPLLETARHPLAQAKGAQLAAVPGQLWLLNDHQLARFLVCP